MLRDQMVEPGISRPYCQKSEMFYCGARGRAGKTGAASRASSEFSDGCLTLFFDTLLYNSHRDFFKLFLGVFLLIVDFLQTVDME